MTDEQPDPADGERPDGERPGVGPWPGGPSAWPPIGPGSPYDPALLADGDRRNVEDRYRYWSLEAVVADLDRTRAPLHVAIENFSHDLNIGSVVRTANAYNVAGVHIVGRRRWNRRGAMVTDRYLHVHHHPQVADLLTWARSADLPVLGIDNVPGSVPIEGYRFPRACVLLLGNESDGLSAPAREGVETILHITQHGSTRSLNAGAAAAIAMYAWATTA